MEDGPKREIGEVAPRVSTAPRASSAPRPSGTPRPARSANLRLVFAFVWIAVQVGMVATAGRRPDGAFGFRMFSESSTIKLTLYREVDGTGQRVEAGRWSARAADGNVHRVTWYDRVPSPYWPFEQEVHASYGAAAQLSRLQLALDDVAAHIPHDDETRRLILEVSVRRNGREPVLRTLTSRERVLSRGGGS